MCDNTSPLLCNLLLWTLWLDTHLKNNRGLCQDAWARSSRCPQRCRRHGGDSAPRRVQERGPGWLRPGVANFPLAADPAALTFRTVAKLPQGSCHNPPVGVGEEQRGAGRRMSPRDRGCKDKWQMRAHDSQLHVFHRLPSMSALGGGLGLKSSDESWFKRKRRIQIILRCLIAQR